MQREFASEKVERRDPVSGRIVIQWTASVARDNHLYFTSPSVTSDDRWLVILSERTGPANLYVLSRPDGHFRRVSENSGGTQRSYCWPSGGHFGLSKASPVLDPMHNRLFYIQDETIFRADLDAAAEPRALWRHPPGWWSGFTHVSPDGKSLCVPLAHPLAFPDGLWHQRQQLKLVPQVMHEIAAWTSLYLIDTDSGVASELAQVPFWVTHVQFDPLNTGRLIFNQEGERVSHHSRIWCMEPDGRYQPLYNEPEDEFDNHENWSTDGSMIVYHGTRSGVPLMAARTWEGSLEFEWMLPDHRIGHTTPNADASGFVTDGGGYVSEFRRAGDGTIEQTILCEHQATSGPYLDQDDHVHPLTTPDGRSVVFSSNRDGVSNVYEVPLGIE